MDPSQETLVWLHLTCDRHDRPNYRGVAPVAPAVDEAAGCAFRLLRTVLCARYALLLHHGNRVYQALVVSRDMIPEAVYGFDTIGRPQTPRLRSLSCFKPHDYSRR